MESADAVVGRFAARLAALALPVLRASAPAAALAAIEERKPRPLMDALFCGVMASPHVLRGATRATLPVTSSMTMFAGAAIGDRVEESRTFV
jgi:hypothetical protein